MFYIWCMTGSDPNSTFRGKGKLITKKDVFYKQETRAGLVGEVTINIFFLQRFQIRTT